LIKSIESIVNISAACGDRAEVPATRATSRQLAAEGAFWRMKPRRATARADPGDPTILAELPFRTLDALTRAQTQDQPLDPAASPIARRSA
jgi:hypothetical protein